MRSKHYLFVLVAMTGCQSRNVDSQVQSTPEVTRGYQRYLCDGYEVCRDQFRLESDRVGGKVANYRRWQQKVPSATDDDLTIDFAYMPRPDAKKLLVLVSGIHGLEGYAGSSLQAFYLATMFERNRADGMSVLLIHGMNPYGMKYRSRYTEQRVDLNRNWFVADDFVTERPDQLYDKYHDLFNPKEAARFSPGDFRSFVAKKLAPNVRSIFSGELTRAAGQGQYRYPKGIVYGGGSYEPQRKIFVENMGEYWQRYDDLLLLDLHTGLGERSMQLLPNAAVSPALKDRRKKIFEDSGFTITATGDSTFYSSFGDFSDFACHYMLSKYPTKRCGSMLLEYGTMMEKHWNEWPAPARIFKQSRASALTLYLMVRENQAHHYGVADGVEGRSLRSELPRLFYPPDRDWQTMLLSDTLVLWPRFLSRFAEIKD